MAPGDIVTGDALNMLNVPEVAINSYCRLDRYGAQLYTCSRPTDLQNETTGRSFAGSADQQEKKR